MKNRRGAKASIGDHERVSRKFLDARRSILEAMSILFDGSTASVNRKAIAAIRSIDAARMSCQELMRRDHPSLSADYETYHPQDKVMP